MPPWLLILILLSTGGGLMFAAFAMWLEFKKTQSQIDKSTGELEQRVAEQQDELHAARRRIQNLEAIVTSQVWDAIHEEEQPEAGKQAPLSQPLEDLDDPEENPSDAERAAELARRLKT